MTVFVLRANTDLTTLFIHVIYYRLRPFWSSYGTFHNIHGKEQAFRGEGLPFPVNVRTAVEDASQFTISPII
jgi:hypothetical protein